MFIDLKNMYIYLAGVGERRTRHKWRPIINFTYFEFNWINFQPDIWFIASHRIVSLCAMMRMCAELERFLMILFPLSIKHFNHHRSDRWVKRCCCCCWSMMLMTMIFNMRFGQKVFSSTPSMPERDESIRNSRVQNLRWKRSPVILNWTWLVDEHCVRHTPQYIQSTIPSSSIYGLQSWTWYFIIRYIPFVHWLISHLTGSRNSHVAPRNIYANMKSNLEIEMGETRVDMHWTCVMICSRIVCLPLGLRMHIVLLLALYMTLGECVCERVYLTILSYGYGCGFGFTISHHRTSISFSLVRIIGYILCVLR